MIYFSNIFTTIVFLAIGVLAGKSGMKYKSKHYDYALIVLLIVSFWIGTNSFLLKILSFEARFSVALTALFLGILVRRHLLKYLRIPKLNY